MTLVMGIRSDHAGADAVMHHGRRVSGALYSGWTGCRNIMTIVMVWAVV